MHQSKLLQFLRTFSNRQFSQFRDFLASPYFNKGADVVAFYDFIVSYAPDFQHKALEKQGLIKKFKSDKPLSDKRLSYLMNQLLGLAETFVAVETFQQTPLDSSFALLGTLSPGDLPRHYKSALEKAKNALDGFPFRNAEFYAESYQLAALVYQVSDPDQHQQNADLQAASNALDTYFIVEKLRYCWVMANFEYILNIKYDWQIGTWLLDYLDKHEPELPPAAVIYRLGIRMTQEPEQAAYFFQLKELLEKYSQEFNANERKLLYTSLLNYCIRRINRFNDQEFSQEYLEINKQLLANGFLFESGHLPPWRFLNLVNTGLRNGQVEWVQNFIQQYRDRLPGDYAEDVSLAAQGQYYYHLKEYSKAQVLLNQANPRDVLLAVTIRNLLTRIYYETGETELLLSFLEAYRVYLLRQDLLSTQMKQQARRFVDFTRKLAKIGRPEAVQLHKLQEDLPAASEIYHRDWLAMQINQKMVEFNVSS
ncbi:MAG: hypothetical protein EP344_03040 [Bacteroidetes bacterium]|nr:MAG: hypothetical protein EP344_03040 [Bacteroidota bacterium]